jgi:hypothetical protein
MMKQFDENNQRGTLKGVLLWKLILTFFLSWELIFQPQDLMVVR